MSAYKQKKGGLQLRTLIPAGKNPDEFLHKLGRRFKNVRCNEMYGYSITHAVLQLSCVPVTARGGKLCSKVDGNQMTVNELMHTSNAHVSSCSHCWKVAYGLLIILD